MTRNSRPRFPEYFSSKGADHRKQPQSTQRIFSDRVANIEDHLVEIRQGEDQPNLFPSRFQVPSRTHAHGQGQRTQPGEPSYFAQAESPTSPVPRQFSRGLNISGRFTYREPHACSNGQPRVGDERVLYGISKNSNQPVELAGTEHSRVIRPLYGHSSRNQSLQADVPQTQNQEPGM